MTFDGSTSVDWDGKLVRYQLGLRRRQHGRGRQGEHSYEQPGAYQARLTVTDDSGSSCASAADLAEVHVDAPPVAVAGPDRKGFVGGAYDQLLFDASASSDADGQPLSFTWDLGDGVTRTGEKVLHAYASPANTRSGSGSPTAPGSPAASRSPRSRSTPRAASRPRRSRRKSRVGGPRRQRMRLNLRTKLLLFAIAIAIVPLLVAGRTMIRIAQDELKSSANEQLVNTAQQLAAEIDDLYERTWLAPLVLIRNAVDDQRLGVQEKISLLTLGIADIPDIVALQLTVEGAALPLVVVKDDFSAHLKAASLDPLEILRVPASLIGAMRESNDGYVQRGPAHPPDR